jgi:hypothetical protein
VEIAGATSSLCLVLGWVAKPHQFTQTMPAITENVLIVEDPFAVVALAMPAEVSIGDLLSLVALELTTCFCNIRHDFSSTPEKLLKPGSMEGYIFACARGYDIHPSSLLEVTDEINLATTLFYNKQPGLKNRPYLEILEIWMRSGIELIACLIDYLIKRELSLY